MDAIGRRHLLFVPVRESATGTLALRTGRLPSGQLAGLAFTAAAALQSALGPGQPWIRLDEDALRDMLALGGIAQIQVDPRLSAPPRTPASPPAQTPPAQTPPSRAPAVPPCPQVPAVPVGTRRSRRAGLACCLDAAPCAAALRLAHPRPRVRRGTRGRPRRRVVPVRARVGRTTRN
jgi:hypothetical protein